MRKLFALAALVLFTAFQMAAQTAQPGTLINGPDRVIQKPVCGYFVGGDMKMAPAGAKYRIVLRTNTADGDIVTVYEKFHEVYYEPNSADPKRKLHKFEVCDIRSRDNLRIDGDDSSGYVIQDDNRVYMRLVPIGYNDEYLVYFE